MTYADIIARYGSLTAAARALDLPISTVHAWRTRVPRAWQAALTGRYAPPCPCRASTHHPSVPDAPEGQESTTAAG